MTELFLLGIDMGNLCAGGASSPTHIEYDYEAPITPVQQRSAAATPGQSPLRQVHRHPPLGTPTRTPGNAVELRMLEHIRRMRPEVDRLVSATYDIEPLASQYQAALRVREQIGRRLDGDIRAGGGDDFTRRIGRINRQIVNFYARHPSAALYPALELRGSAANIPTEVLQVASNRLMSYETMVSYDDADARDKLNVLAHLQDISNNQLTSPLVIEAARRSNNDPATLVDNLLALVQQNPPVLSLHSRAMR